MKPDIYFFDEWNSSRWNGVGTYRDTLLPLLARMAGKVTLVSLNSFVERVAVRPIAAGREISVPFVDGGWRRSGSEIAAWIKPFMNDAGCKCFMFNHSPCADFMEALRDRFPEARFSFTVHDQGWCSLLMGDHSLLNDIIVRDTLPSIVSRRTADIVKLCCRRENDIYRRADAVVSLCPSASGVLANIYGVPVDKIHTIPNGYTRASDVEIISRTEARRRLGISPAERLVLFVGRAVRHKGIEVALRLAAELRAAKSSLKVVIAGSQNGLSGFSDLIEAAAGNLILSGFLSKNMLALWYQAVDVGLLCSYVEQCSYAALEMMDLTEKIVAGDGYGLNDMFEADVDVFGAVKGIVNDDTEYVGSILDALDRAMSAQPALSEKMRLRRKAKLRDRYSPQAMKAGYRTLFGI